MFTKKNKPNARVEMTVNATDNVVTVAACIGLTAFASKVIETGGILLLGMMDNHHEEKMAKKGTIKKKKDDEE